MNDWNDSVPIYLQLRAIIVQRILAGTLAEGEAVPSVRQVAADEQINPITISKTYQMLVDEGLLEKRRGLGMFVLPEARTLALQQEREAFLNDEWPVIKARIELLDLELAALLGNAQGGGQ